MDSLSATSPVQSVTLIKGAQLGGTEAGSNWIGYLIDHAPGPCLAVQPTVEMAKRNSKQRIEPLIQESSRLREKVKSPRSRDSGNTILAKEFPGGLLVMTGANSAVGLRSLPARTDGGPSHQGWRPTLRVGENPGKKQSPRLPDLRPRRGGAFGS